MKLFIGCSASNSLNKIYYEECSKVFTEIFSHEIDLVFGACYSGLMALAHDIALKNQRKIIGVCPKVYAHDFNNLKCNEEIITNNISDRTIESIMNSDVILFMPGGIGSLYELFTAIECKRCHEFDKPIIIYNINNYYDDLISFIDKMYISGFANDKFKDIYTVIDNVNDLIKQLKSYL